MSDVADEVVKKHRQTLMVASFTLVAALAALLCPFDIKIGQTHFQRTVKKLPPNTPEPPQGYEHIIWNGPTGEVSHGSIHSLRLANWLWEFNISRGL